MSREEKMERAIFVKAKQKQNSSMISMSKAGAISLKVTGSNAG